MARSWIVLAIMALAAAPTGAQPSAAPAPALPLPFTATGHEPGWRLEITASGMTLVTDYGATTLRTGPRLPEPVPGGWRYAGNADGRVLIVKVLDRICEDIATGMPRPNTVEVTVDEDALKGCGGDPAALLRGAPWVVEGIAGAALGAESRVTIAFAEGGRLAGQAPCHAFTSGYTITGEGLILARPVVTGDVCASAVMQREQVFLGVLAAVTRFEIEPDGTLVLHAGDGRTLRARR